jgi:acetyl-CoA synthetase
MAWATIEKHGRGNGVEPNLGRYVVVDPDSFWEQARSSLDGLPGGRGLNIAYEAVDRHAAGAISPGRRASRAARR